MLARVLRWYMPYWRMARGGLGIIFALTVLGIATRTLYPVIFKFIIDALTENVDLHEARRWVLVLFGMGLLRSLSQAVLPSSRAWMNIVNAMNIRLEMIRRILRKRHGFFQKYQPGDLVARLTDDVDAMDKLSWYSCSGVFRPIEAGLTLLFSLAVMFTLHWKLTLASTLPLPLIVWLLSKTEHLQHKRYRERQEATSRTVEAMESAFSGSRIVVGFNMESAQERLFDGVLVERERAEKHVVVLRALLENISALLNQTGLVIVLFAGGWFVLNDPAFTLGDFYAFVAYLSGLTMPLWTISWFFVSTNVADTSIKRLVELEKEPERRPGERRVEGARPALEMERVAFAFTGGGGLPVLREVSFSLRPGETVALVGPVGCGKSTLLECAVGLLEPRAGRVALGGVALAELSDEERARRIGYAPQEPHLFSGDVAMNVTLGRDEVDGPAVRRSLETACLGGEVTLSQEVAPGGRGLSGGQRARVALGRAIAGAPDILVLDDVTSALDAATEQRFWDGIRDQLPEAGILVSTHREATAQRADRVLWLEDGVILHEGSHEALLAAQPGYQRLFAAD